MDPIRSFSRSNSCARVFLLLVFSLLNPISRSVVFAGHHEDVEAALNLYMQVEQFLEKKLNRPDAPASYRNSYALFKAKDFAIRKLLSENPRKAADILNSSLSFPGMSHLRFKKLKKGSLGIEFSKCDGARVDKVYPNSPAEKCGIKVGDYLDLISGMPISQIDFSSISEDTAYSCTAVVLRKGKTIKFSEPIKLGIKVKLIEDGLLQVMWVDPKIIENIHVGDLIDTINGVVPSQEDVAGINEDKVFINPCIHIKGKSISLKALPEESFKQSSFGFSTKVNQDGTHKITRVFPDSHAARLGLKKGDTILTVDGVLCDEVKLKPPGAEVTIHVKKSNGLVSPFKLTLSSVREWDQTFFKEVEHQGKRAIYVRIADFGEEYSPQVIHEALKAAKDQFIIFDLRGNFGGRSEHLLSYFLKPEARIVNWLGVQGREKGVVIRLSDFLNGKKSQVKEDSFPFFGRVAFLVDEDTRCAAEMCVLAPVEYQSLRKKKEINGIKYNGELYPRKIMVIGKSGGGAQVLEEMRFTNRLGQFVLDYPFADIYTCINKQCIEGTGIDGIPIRDSVDSDGMDPEIIQAIEWNEKEKLAPVKYEMVDF